MDVSARCIGLVEGIIVVTFQRCLCLPYDYRHPYATAVLFFDGLPALHSAALVLLLARVLMREIITTGGCIENDSVDLDIYVQGRCVYQAQQCLLTFAAQCM